MVKYNWNDKKTLIIAHGSCANSTNRQQRENTQHNSTLNGFLFVDLYELNVLTCSYPACESCFQPIASWACAVSLPHGCYGSHSRSSPWRQPVTQTGRWAGREPANTFEKWKTHSVFSVNEQNGLVSSDCPQPYENNTVWTFWALLMATNAESTTKKGFYYWIFFSHMIILNFTYIWGIIVL